MNRNVLWLASLLAVSGLQMPPVVHAQSAASAINREDVQKRIAEAKTRLHLSDQQVEAIKPLAAQEADKLRAIRARYGESPSRREKYSMFNEARSVAASFNAGMAKILDADQMAIWKQMQDEKRSQLKAEFQRRQSGAN